jgi:SAM-dependent methyltransferase
MAMEDTEHQSLRTAGTPLEFVEYCCPQCKRALRSLPGAYVCDMCDVRFPIVLGIADFRVFPDPYIGYADDHQKGRRIAERARDLDFRALVEYYWSITPEEPPEMARRFTAHALAAADRGRHLLDSLEGGRAKLKIGADSRVLELGCRTGGLLVAAAERFDQVVGIDIAFRWLVIARKRLEEVGRPVQLLCCCAEFLPFAGSNFELVLGENVLEHTARQQQLIEEAYRVLKPHGVFFATTWNRLSAAPEPHVRLWGVGWLPAALAKRYVKLRRGVSYDHVRLLSLFQLVRMFRGTSFGRCEIRLPEFSEAELANISPSQRQFVRLYHRMKDWPVIHTLLRLLAPVFQILCRRGSASGVDQEPEIPASVRSASRE